MMVYPDERILVLYLPVFIGCRVPVDVSRWYVSLWRRVNQACLRRWCGGGRDVLVGCVRDGSDVGVGRFRLEGFGGEQELTAISQ